MKKRNEKQSRTLNGYTKKTQKTPKKEIDKALDLMNSYYEDKNK